MCSRYYFDNDTMNDILNIVEKTDASLQGMQTNRDIYPTDEAAVIMKDTYGRIKISVSLEIFCNKHAVRLITDFIVQLQSCYLHSAIQHKETALQLHGINFR